MAITPQDIQAIRFSEARRGYDPDEVDKFHEQVAADIASMIRKIVDLKNRLTECEEELASVRSQGAQMDRSEYYVDDQPTSHGNPSVTEKQISDALIAAQQTADRIVESAKEDSVRIRTEAENKSREIIRETLIEKQRELDEISRLRESRESFRSDYMALVNHFLREAEDEFPEPMLSNTPNGSEAAQPVFEPQVEEEVPAEVEEVEDVETDQANQQTRIAPVATPFGAQASDFDVDELD